MSMVSVHFGWILFDTMPIAVELSICIVFGWGCPISSSKNCMGTVSLMLMYSSPSSVFVAKDITAFMIVKRQRICSLFGGNFELYDI